jgi:hypothetical protein
MYTHDKRIVPYEILLISGYINPLSSLPLLSPSPLRIMISKSFHHDLMVCVPRAPKQDDKAMYVCRDGWRAVLLKNISTTTLCLSLSREIRHCDVEIRKHRSHEKIGGLCGAEVVYWAYILLYCAVISWPQHNRTVWVLNQCPKMAWLAALGLEIPQPGAMCVRTSGAI